MRIHTLYLGSYTFLFVFNFLFFKNLFWMGGYLLCNVVLVSPVQQRESAVSIHIFPLSWALSHPHPTLVGHHRAARSSLRCTEASHRLFILRTALYVCQHYSLGLPCPFFSLLSPQVYSLCLHLYSCPAHRFIIMDFLLQEYHLCCLFLTRQSTINSFPFY